MINITNLNKFYNKNKSNEIHVINNTSIKLPKCGLVTIYGESGCGKTTLLNVIGGLDNFDSGTIEIDGFEINKYNYKIIDKIRNEKIGYIFQNYLLLNQRTVYDNLKIVLTMYKVSEEEINYRIDYVLKAVGMLKYKKKLVNELSGGQQQRIGIARALIKSPAVILADEPTGNLDEKTTIEIMNILKKISQSTLVVMVSHEYNIVRSYSDLIINVKDGHVIDQIAINDNNLYSYTDDQSLYLKEYNHETIDNENFKIDFYSNANKKINLEIIYENNQFYIRTNDKIVLVDKQSEIKIIDDYKKELNTEFELNNNSYDLERLEYKKEPKLSFKDIFTIATTNLKQLKKRTIFLTIPLFIMSILLILSVQSMIIGGNVDVYQIVTSHSNIYNISFEKNDVNMNSNTCKKGFEIFCEDLLNECDGIEFVISKSVKLKYTLEKFTQLKKNTYEIQGFSLLSTEQLNNNLYYGRMPETSKEIVVEKWVLEKALEDTTLKNFMSVKSFINEEVNVGSNNFKFKIVGIADNDQHAVYVNKWHMFDIFDTWFNVQRYSIGSLNELGEYVDISNIELNDNEFLLSSDKTQTSIVDKLEVNDDANTTYYLKEKIDFGGAPFDIIVKDNQYNNLMQHYFNKNWKELNVYYNNDDSKEKLIDFIDNMQLKFENNEIIDEDVVIKMKVYGVSKYDELLTPYIESANQVVKSRLLITFTIIMISILIVFFSMKSFSVKNIYDIGVYRAIGIKKMSILLIYIMEILILSSKTIIIGNGLCYLITNIISGIPIITINFAISFELFIISTLLLIILNIIITIIPINKYLRLTPYKILTKYDI